MIQKELEHFYWPAMKWKCCQRQSIGKGKKVVLDYYFNNENKKDAFGQMERFHYTWEEYGQQRLFNVWKYIPQYGAKTEFLRDSTHCSII